MNETQHQKASLEQGRLAYLQKVEAIALENEACALIAEKYSKKAAREIRDRNKP